MMIVQSTPIILKQRNQPNRECLYAWYPEVVTPTSMEPRDIYIHKGIDRDLIQGNSSINGCKDKYCFFLCFYQCLDFKKLQL